jgi:hypothetical protein
MNAKHFVLAASVALLTACGGGGDDPAPPPAPLTQVPDSAMASSAAMVSFIKTMMQDDSSEPLTMSPQASPTSDTEEPLPGA